MAPLAAAPNGPSSATDWMYDGSGTTCLQKTHQPGDQPNNKTTNQESTNKPRTNRVCTTSRHQAMQHACRDKQAGRPAGKQAVQNPRSGMSWGLQCSRLLQCSQQDRAKQCQTVVGILKRDDGLTHNCQHDLRPPTAIGTLHSATEVLRRSQTSVAFVRIAGRHRLLGCCAALLHRA